MSDDPSYYEILGVPPDATLEQIGLAYRNKAMLCHPDKNPQGDPQISNETMQAVNVAYKILINPMKRAEYDHTLARGASDGIGHGSEQQAAKNILALENTTSQSEITVVGSPQVVTDDFVNEAIKQRDWAKLSDVFSKHINDDKLGQMSVLAWHMKEFERRLFRTVLHVAVMYGCFPLVKQLLDMLTDDIKNIGKKKALAFIREKDRRSGLMALEMADEIIGNRSISEYIKLVVRFLESSEDTISDFIGNSHEVLFEAYLHTRWYGHLKYSVESGKREERNPMTYLKYGLRENSRLLLETFHGLSALHLAILFNDEDLIETIQALFDGEERIVWGDSYYPPDLSWKKMIEAVQHGGRIFKKDIFYKTEFNSLPYYRVSASEIAKIIVNSNPPGSSAVSERVRSILEDKPLLPPSQHNAKLLEQFSRMGDHINQEWDREWQKSFEADVDFNFEVEPRKSLLRVHHACKDPLAFQDFLKSISQHGMFQMFSIKMHDGQGRTLHHILLDHYTVDKLPGWAFTEILSPEVSKYCIRFAQDSKGRKLMDVLIGKNFIQENIILKPYSYFDMKFDQDYAKLEGYSRVLGNFYVACALQQTNIASQPTWVEALEVYLSKRGELKLLTFATATSTNQSMLQALSRMEPPFDLMVQDKKKRTLLHYAANPTLFKWKTLSKVGSEYECSMISECFSTVKDYCQFMKKKSSRNGGVHFKDHNSTSNVDEKDELKQANARRRALILMLRQEGLDLSQQDNHGKVPSLGPTSDAEYQTWWYDLVVKDATDNKQSFNQAGNALSVVGTLVAATSYIGPLQPPMNYDGGLVRHSEKLVEVFMVTNTLAFFLAMASVMFAVVPSLPMPRESIMSELKRARKMVLVSLCLLLFAIATIIVSFSAASVVVRQYEHSFPRSNILLGPLLIGWCICFIAIGSFFIRILRLSLYENAIVQGLYRFSLWKFCTKTYFDLFLHDLRDIAKYINGSFLMRPGHRIYKSSTFLRKMIEILQSIYIKMIYVFFVVFPFLIYHALHISILIPCRQLYAHWPKFCTYHRCSGRFPDDDEP